MADEDQAPITSRCPGCGEHRAEWLVRISDDTLQCESCGIRHCPIATRRDDSLPPVSGERLIELYGAGGKQLDEEQVDDLFACPLCGERRATRLVFDADWEVVTCTMCGSEYRPDWYGEDKPDDCEL